MQVLNIFQNGVLLCALLGWAVAQICKIILMLVWYHDFSIGRIFGAGGMPSTHSATVTALTCAVGITCGFASALFAMSLIISMVVIYDSVGVRYHAGCHAKYLNELQQDTHIPDISSKVKIPFQEKLGHTVPEVIVGIILGVLVALIYPF